MHGTFTASVVASRPSHLGITRIAFAIIAAAGILTATNRAVEAQTSPNQKPGWELLVPSGRLVPTGAHRNTIKRGGLIGAQISRIVRPPLAITATLAWARSRDIASADHPKLDIFVLDLGAEARAPRWIGGSTVAFRPFAGVGVGLQSYNYRSLRVDATHNPAAYAGGGAELSVRRVRFRFEARDYVTGFKPLDGKGSAETRSDVILMAGLRFASR